MPKTFEFEYDLPQQRLFATAVRAVSELGYSILHTEDAAASVTFNTGASMWSNAGQDMTASAVALSADRSKLVVGGRAAQRGKEAQFGSWGERGRIARRLGDRVRALLVVPPVSHSLPPTAPASPVDELLKLSELHRSGALTDEEFSQAKGRLLGR
jgi:Short C-terminal domain